MLFKKESKTISVAFDIGTASVSAVLFEVSDTTHTPSIIKTYRKFHKTPLRDDDKHFSKATISQVTAILTDISHDQPAMPSSYIIGLSSIFYLGKTERIDEHFEKTKILSQADIDGFIEKGRQKFFSDLKREDVLIFEVVLMKSLLNGYEVNQPVGKRAEEVELWAHYAATSNDVYDSFTSAIHGISPNAHITFATFPVNVWLLMGSHTSSEQSVMLVDIGGELTDISFITNGVLNETLSLPVGVLNILLRISEVENSDLENALSLLRSYTSGTLEEGTKKRIHDIIKKEMKSWEDFFERVWQRASRAMMSNIQMYFLGGGALVEDIKSAVAPPLLHPDLARDLKASIITPDAFQDKFASFSGFDGPGDFALMSLVLNAPIIVKK